MKWLELGNVMLVMCTKILQTSDFQFVRVNIESIWGHQLKCLDPVALLPPFIYT